MAGISSIHNDSLASSSSRSPNERPDDRDELAHLWAEDQDDDAAGPDLLDDDPIHGDLSEPLSFKRKQKQSVLSSPARFLSALTGSRTPSRPDSHSPHLRPDLGDGSPFPRLASPRRNIAHQNPSHGPKDGSPLDWYAEGPGRRVGYEDLTAIDWIFEYTKERQRLRVLYSRATGLLGYAQQFLDASQVWVILVLTGMAVGAVAASIDITTDWLGDLKTGYCSSGPEGGAFYLNKGFCCYGYDYGATCKGWRSWGEALGVRSSGGKWFIEYFFFITFSVGSCI
jgi:chloride channel 3/4/5